MFKVLILGSTGLIGHQVYNYLHENTDYKLSNFSYRRKLNESSILIDAKDFDELKNRINTIEPKYIVNCIGTLINQSNIDPQSAILLNAYLPHKLEDIANSIGAKLIHMSTDCVFSGNKNEPYVESDFKDGKDMYSKSKGLGEIVNHRHLTLRTSVVGPELKEDGVELFNWFMSQEGAINGFTNAIWSGVTTHELSKAVKWGIDNDITGLYHVTNNQLINKNDLLNLFKKHTGKNIQIISQDDMVNNKSFIDSRKLIDYSIPSYDEMIFDMVSLILKNKSLYPHYKL